MKQDFNYIKIQQKMRKGLIVRDGFLGDDKRNLIDIIEEDNETVKRIGLTHEKIADVLVEFKKIGEVGLGDLVNYKGYFEIKVETYRGKLPCPFGDKGVFQKNEITVINKKLNEKIVYTELSIHLIKEHGFYQGKGSVYRLDPEKIVQILEIL